MENNKLSKVLIGISILLFIAIGGAVYVLFVQGPTKAVEEVVEVTPSPTPTSTPKPTATSTPKPSPSTTPKPTASATPTATPTPTPSPTATPTVLPQIEYTVSNSDVNSENGAEVAIQISGDSAISYTTTCSEGISTWIEPGFLYIYPSQSGTVTLTGTLSGFQKTSKTINVNYVVVATPEPTPVPTDQPSTSSGVLSPTLTRGDDLSFWFRNNMSDCKDYFFDYAASNGVDPWLVIAIACHETGYGASSLCYENNNFGGMIGSDGNWKSFATKASGVDELCWLIGWYNRQGRTTIESIAELYCPNDPVWIERVTAIYNSFHK